MLSVWNQGHCCHFHRIDLLMEIAHNCHPSSLCNLMGFLDNLYPWLWRRFWHMFRWAERWGIHSLPALGRHLGMRVRLGLHLHLNSFLHMLWLVAWYCTQFEIPSHLTPNLSGIWNSFNEGLSFGYIYLSSLHPQLVLAGLDWSRDLTATQFFQEWWIS